MTLEILGLDSFSEDELGVPIWEICHQGFGLGDCVDVWSAEGDMG